MVTGEIRNIRSEKADLRKFGIVVGVGLAVFGGIFLWRGKTFYPYLFYASAVLLVSGFAFPIVLKPLHKVWMAIAILLGWVMTRLLLSVLFFVVLTPIGLLLKLFGKDFLELGFDSSTESYWVKRERSLEDRSRYERQF